MLSVRTVSLQIVRGTFIYSTGVDDTNDGKSVTLRLGSNSLT